MLVLAACGGSGGVAGQGNFDGGQAGKGGDAQGESRDVASGGETAPDLKGPEAGPDLALDTPVEAPPSGDAADGRADGDAALEVGGDVPSPKDAPSDGDAAPAVDAPGAEAGTDTTPAGDTAGDRVSMACTAPGGCDPFDPAACGAQLCRVQADGNTACIAGAATLKQAGAACTFTNECADGLDCIQIGDDPGFTCQKTCPKGSLGFCGGELRCTSFFTGCVQFCRPRDVPCDIYAQNCADTTKACALSLDSETGERYTGCRPAGPGARGDRCETVVCGKGLLCVRENGVSTCRQVCTGDGGALPCTGVGETCAGLTSTYQITYCK
jgi:hypothetical protein